MGLLGNDDGSPAFGGFFGTTFDDPKTQLLLGLSAGLLNAGGASTTPTGLGQGLSQGLLLGNQMYSKARAAQLDSIKAQALQMDVAKKKQVMNLINNAFGGQDFGAGSQPATAQPSGDSAVPPWATKSIPLAPQPDVLANAPRNNAISGAGFPFNLNQTMALKMAGAGDFFPEYKYAHDGIQRQGGSYYQNPITGQTQYYPNVPEGMTVTNDGRMAPMPGVVGSVAAIEGAKSQAQEGAKAGYDLVQVTNPDGSTSYRTRASIVGQQAPSQVPGAGQSVMASRSPAATTYDTDVAKYYADMSKKIQEAGVNAPSRIATLDTINSLLSDHDGGRLSPAGTQLASAMNSLGIKVDPKLPNKEAATALANKLTLSARTTANGEGMPGAMSDADRNFLAQMNPSISQSAAGRGQLIGIQKTMLQRQIDVSGMARKWESQFGQLNSKDSAGKNFFDYLEIWRNKNPLFGQSDQGQQ